MQKSEYIKFVYFFDERFIRTEKEKGGVKSQFGSPHLFAKLRGCQNFTAKLGKRLYLFAKEEKRLVQQCVNENARIALDQEEYQKRYDGLAEWFDGVKARLDEITHTITERQAKRQKIEMFLSDWKNRRV